MRGRVETLRGTSRTVLTSVLGRRGTAEDVRNPHHLTLVPASLVAHFGSLLVTLIPFSSVQLVSCPSGRVGGRGVGTRHGGEENGR